jgi:hypothetical protein
MLLACSLVLFAMPLHFEEGLKPVFWELQRLGISGYEILIVMALLIVWPAQCHADISQLPFDCSLITQIYPCVLYHLIPFVTQQHRCCPFC